LNNYPYIAMKEKQDALERLDLCIRWGPYDIHVLRFHLVEFPPGRVIGYHKHAEYEFHFIPKGKGKVILIDQAYALRSGMFYLTGPEVLHYQEVDAHEPMDELCLHVHIVDRTLLEGGQEEAYEDDWEAAEARACIEKLEALPLFPTNDLYDAMHCFLKAYEACTDSYTGSYITIKQNVIQILLRSVRAYDTVNEQNQLPAKDMSNSRYKLALEFIKANYSMSISLEDVAEKVSLSTRHIQRLFKELHHGQTFSRVLEDIRLEAVCRELVGGNQSIDQIAKITGFAGGNYLHYVFRKRYGMTPSEYRVKIN
jgi:AraC-like DNA-binding protein